MYKYIDTIKKKMLLNFVIFDECLLLLVGNVGERSAHGTGRATPE